MNPFRAVLLLPLVTFLFLANAEQSAGQVYKVTDENGNVVFTDRPPNIENPDTGSVEEITLPEVNTVTPIEPRPAEASAGQELVVEEVPLEVRITSPANETTIAMGPGNFGVSASATPPLSAGEKLLLTMDGQAVGDAQSSGSWFLEGVLRGPHDLVVQRTTARGKVLATSEPVRVYVLRPSVIRR